MRLRDGMRLIADNYGNVAALNDEWVHFDSLLFNDKYIVQHNDVTVNRKWMNSLLTFCKDIL
jgi:hypothetical protein